MSEPVLTNARPDEPANNDPVVRGFSERFGGPLGVRAVRPPRRAFWTPVRVVLALSCIVFALHWVQKAPCQDGAWVDLKQYRHLCYTDVLALYYAERLDDGAVPYRDHEVEYPVLTGAFMGLLGLPVNALGEALRERGDAINEGQWFYNLNALVLSALGVATVGVVLALRRRRPWDAAMLALAPAVVVTATVNWDYLAIALTAFAMLAWSRTRHITAGVLLGLAIAAKFYPLLLLGPLILLALRSRRFVEALQTTATAAVVWFVVNFPVAWAWPDSWSKFFRLNSERGIDWGTLWYILEHFPRFPFGEGYGLGVGRYLGQHLPVLHWVSFVLFGLGCLAIGLLAILAPRRPRLAPLVFLTVAVFLITSKVWSQQYVLWLIPLAVLARPRWGAFLAWQAAEVCYFCAFYGELMMASGKPVFPEFVFVAASVGRLVTLAVLCGFVVRDILRPEQDAVRRGGDDDPDGGVLDGAEDAPWVARVRESVAGRRAVTAA